MVIRIDPGASGLRWLGRYKAAACALALLAGALAVFQAWGPQAAPRVRPGGSVTGRAMPPSVPSGVTGAGPAKDGTALPEATAQSGLMRAVDPSLSARHFAHLTPAQRADGRVFVAYDMAWLPGRKVGEDIELALPRFMAKATARIESVSETDGMTTWSGVIRSGDARGRFSITQTGRQGAYAVGSIQGPSGVAYTLEARDGMGWVAPQGHVEEDEGGIGHDHAHDHDHEAQ